MSTDDPGAPSSIMSEIEALAALVGESEEQSLAPIPAPTASIARSRPMLDALSSAPLLAPASDPARFDPARSDPARSDPIRFEPAPSTSLTPMVLRTSPIVIEPFAVEPVSPAPFETVQFEAAPPKTAPSATALTSSTPPAPALLEPGALAPQPQPEASDLPVDPTVPLDRLNPGDSFSTATTQLQGSPSAPYASDTAKPFSSGSLSDSGKLALLDAMPVAVFLIDSMATMRYVNVRTADMLGLPRAEVLGRNVLDFVNVDDLDFAAELFNGGSRFGQSMMGPSRLRYVDALGVSHWTQVWAQSAPELLGVDGFIITLTNESVRDVLASAVSSLASDDVLDNTLAAIALSARAMPFASRGAVLVNEAASGDDAIRFRMIGDWPIDHQAINAVGTPWRSALEQRENCDVDDVATSGLAPGARQLLGDAGVAALFVRPIIDANRDVVGVFVVFRPDAGEASPNQNDHLHDTVSLASLAFAQKRRRLELETAALQDGLTGVGNRAAFNDRLKTERRAVDVLFIDLDHFKTVNDTFGHEVGDHVVAMAAARIESAIRNDDLVYRTGGDEFVVLCEATGDDPGERIGLAERIVERLREPFPIKDKVVRIGATVGIAAAGDRSLTETVGAADRALYTAKDQGRAGWAHEGL